MGEDTQNQAKKRNFKATVEDAAESDDEEPRIDKSSIPEIPSKKRRS